MIQRPATNRPTSSNRPQMMDCLSGAVARGRLARRRARARLRLPKVISGLQSLWSADKLSLFLSLYWSPFCNIKGVLTPCMDQLSGGNPYPCGCTGSIATRHTPNQATDARCAANRLYTCRKTVLAPVHKTRQDRPGFSRLWINALICYPQYRCTELCTTSVRFCDTLFHPSASMGCEKLAVFCSDARTTCAIHILPTGRIFRAAWRCTWIVCIQVVHNTRTVDKGAIDPDQYSVTRYQHKGSIIMALLLNCLTIRRRAQPAGHRILVSGN